MLANYAKLKGRTLGELTKPKYLEAVMRKYGFRDWESVLAALGHGGLKEGQILNKLIEAYEKEHKKEITDEKVLEAAAEAKEKLPIVKKKRWHRRKRYRRCSGTICKMLQSHSRG